jgi:hypothetical protein
MSHHNRNEQAEAPAWPDTTLTSRKAATEGPEHIGWPPTTRASDAERETVAAALGRSAAQGRLTLEELEQRLSSAYAAKTCAELEPLLADLPDHCSAGGSARRPASPADRRGARRSGGRSGFPVLVVLCWAIWGLSVARSTSHGLEGLWPLWLTAIWVLAFSRRRGRSFASRAPDHRVG